MRCSGGQGAPCAAREHRLDGVADLLERRAAAVTAASKRAAASRRGRRRPAPGSWGSCRGRRRGWRGPRRWPRRALGRGAVKSSPASPARSATRQASSTPGQELLAEREVARRGGVALGRRVGPVAGDGTDDGGHARRAGIDERTLEDDVGVVAGREHPEDLDDERYRARRRRPRRRGSPRCSTALPRAPGRSATRTSRRQLGWGTPATSSSTASDCSRGRRPHPALDELEQLGGVDGVVRGVVDPPRGRAPSARSCPTRAWSAPSSGAPR